MEQGEIQMKKTKLIERQIVNTLKEAEAGFSGRTKPPTRVQQSHLLQMESQVWRHGCQRLKRLKEPEEENRRLKQMYADLSLENKALKDIVEKKL